MNFTNYDYYKNNNTSENINNFTYSIHEIHKKQ